jgi:hypothetical protein
MSLIKKVTVGALAAAGLVALMSRGTKSPPVSETEPKAPAPRRRKQAKRRNKAKRAKTTIPRR